MPAASTLRVLFATPEIAPWVKSGGLGDVSAALPPALNAEGAEVRVLVPGYAPLLAALPEARTVAEISGLGGAYAPARLLLAERGAPVPLFIIDCPPYYRRPGSAYQDADGRDWPDNFLRFGLLSRVAALLSGVQSPVSWRPDVLHCQDWPVGLAPAYLQYSPGPAAVTVMTVHNLAFQGLFPAAMLAPLALPHEALSPDGLEYYGRISFLKSGLYYADHLTTVSTTYAREVQTDELGCGLGGLLRHRRVHLTGIMNGIDTALWNPAADALLAAPYDSAHLADKTVNKLALQKELGLRADARIPLFGTVSRLTHQKGLDLLAACVPQIAAAAAQLAVLGTGEKELEAQFRSLAQAYPQTLAAVIDYDERLAHRIEAGADAFVMPSRFEPCGLNQMYSLRYGTPPIVRATGGLADTVVPVTAANLEAGIATGFVFEEASEAALNAALGRALATWRDSPVWAALQRAGMREDFSWQRSARRYLALFRTLLEAR